MKSKLEDFALEAISHIEMLKDKVQEYRSTIQRQDAHIMRALFTSDREVTKPFYRWDASVFQGSLSRLFTGKPVYLEASISQASNHRHAVKFTKIELLFKAKSAESQAKIDQALQPYCIRMGHSGSSYYQFGSRIHVIQSESVTITHSIAKDKGVYLIGSASLGKLNDGDPILSPYTLWRFQLHRPVVSSTASGEDIHDLLPMIDSMELVGQGIYIDPHSLKNDMGNLEALYGDLEF